MMKAIVKVRRDIEFLSGGIGSFGYVLIRLAVVYHLIIDMGISSGSLRTPMVSHGMMGASCVPPSYVYNVTRYGVGVK